MARALAVEGEAVTVMPDLDDAPRLLQPADRAGHRDRHLGRGRIQRRLQRVLRQEVQHVRDQQLLVLLLVMAAQLDQRQRRLRQVRQRVDQRGIDVRPVRPHFVQRRAGHHAAPVTRVAPPLRLVIAVEQERPALVVQPVARHVIAQHEGLEEPGRVREMPFGGRGVGHRLHGRVRIRQGSGQRGGQCAHGAEPLGDPGLRDEDRLEHESLPSVRALARRDADTIQINDPSPVATARRPRRPRSPVARRRTGNPTND